MSSAAKRCAIYTRKSTDNGLDKDFNTLDAQREACLSYIQSQKGEGWIALKEQYDDGGFTGSNMDRPALQKLLEDIKSKRVDTVVVYKIDRLTRSLMDFAKLVEVFDQYHVTFISITQSFNTTTSMGRLTLNVLLSFAQFEREVISERVRDKIAASKKKGMWMGGKIPVGYQVVNKQLVPKDEEVPFVNMLFERYLALGSVQKLIYELKERSVHSKLWTSKKGNTYGGNFHSRGALYKILNNRTYIGEVYYKGKAYKGQHEGIIGLDLWNCVQRKLKENGHEVKETKSQNNLLTGLICDSEGARYTPTFTNKKGKRYRYYISQNLLQYKDHPNGLIARLPADEIDQIVVKIISDELESTERLALLLQVNPVENYKILKYIADKRLILDVRAAIKSICEKVIISQNSIKIIINAKKTSDFFEEVFSISLNSSQENSEYELLKSYSLVRRSRGEIIIHVAKARNEDRDPFDRPEHEIKNWVKGIVWRDEYFRGAKLSEISDQDPRYIKRMIEYSLEVI